MELRVNLYKSEIIEGYVKRKFPRVTGDDVKKIENQCSREITGVNKGIKLVTRGIKSVCYAASNGYDTNFSASGKINPSLPRGGCRRFGLRGTSTTRGGPASVISGPAVRKRVNAATITNKCRQHVPSTNKALIEKNLNDYLERWNVPSSFTNDKSNPRFTRLNGMGRDISHSHSFHRTDDPPTYNTNSSPKHMLPYSTIPIESDRRLAPVNCLVVPSVKEIEQLTRLVADLRAQHNELLANKSLDDCPYDEGDSTNAELQSKLMKTVMVNDVLLTTTDGWVESIDKDTNTVIIHQTIKGCAGSIPFTLQLLIQQDRNDEGPLENTFVVDLDLNVHKNAQEELKFFLEKMRSCRDVMLCVKGLNDYAIWDNLRRKTFDHFRLLHPGLISMDGQELLIQNYNVRATVTWTVTTEETGHLTPNVSLKVQKTRQAALTDKDNLISRLSHIFQLMLQVFGIERSISTVIEMLDL